MRSLLEEIASTYREANRNAERGGPSFQPFVGISITLSAALRRSRRAAQHGVKRILDYFLKRDVYHVTFYFEEIAPIIGHYDTEDFMVYTTLM